MASSSRHGGMHGKRGGGRREAASNIRLVLRRLHAVDGVDGGLLTAVKKWLILQ